ncbi:hypothetical protein UlMin_036284 [Ulmus minor]
MVSSDAVAGGLGDKQVWPPGFRFHPTDEELVLYYLKRKICRKRLKLNIVAETDVYKWDPDELPGLSILKTGDRQWFFFSPRERKYPNGARSGRGTRHGYWKATGKDRTITCNSRSVGLKKTLVYYKGRAPNGERTDWVMHEYTMDEEELKRCQNVKDYYALYKVYKKSGPGPKNGEQYGAPFREEDWADDDCPDFDNYVKLEIPPKKVDEVISNSDPRVDAQLHPDDIEEFMKQMTEEPILDLPQINENTFSPSQVVSEEVHSSLLEPTSREIIFPEPVRLLNASGQQCNLQNSFDFTQSAISQLRSHEVAEVTSTPNVYEHKPHAIVEEVSHIIHEKDFLEIDDLLDPEPSVAVAYPHDNFQLDGLSELDLFQDAPMFLPDMEPINHPTTSQPYVCSPEQRMASQFDFQFESNSIGERQDSILQYQQGFVPENNQLYFDPATQINTQYPHDASQVDNQHQLNGQHQINAQHHLNDQHQINGQHQMNFPLHINNQHQINCQLYPHDATQIGNQLWTHDEGRNVFPSAEFSHNSLSEPSSGVIYDSSNFQIEVNQTQGGNNDDGATSWFSSALWSFVESIPSTPASAAENVLVNRAFERMSSFSRLRINARNVNVTSTVVAESSTSSAGRKRGFFFLPFIVAIFAILWIMLGAVRVWGRGGWLNV